MKTKLFLTVITVFMTLTIFSACAQNRITNKNFNVDNFTEIESNTIGNIFLKQSSETSVRAEGSEEILGKLKVSVNNGRLKIDMDRQLFKRIRKSNRRLNIYISTPNIETLENNGVGNITFQGKFNSPRLDIFSDGVGNLKAENLDIDQVNVDTDGVGNISLAGKTNSIIIHSDGIGNVDTQELHAQKAHIVSNGVGNVSCFASEVVEVDASGVGNVTYYGNPKDKNITKDGVGKVREGN